MALDKIIHIHLDKMEKLEDELEQFIDKVYEGIDIDAVIEDPEIELMRVTELIKQEIIDKYSIEAMETGFEFADKVNETIAEGDKIEVDDSSDPNFNKGKVDIEGEPTQ